MRKSTKYTLSLYDAKQYAKGNRVLKKQVISSNIITNAYSNIKDEVLQNEITVATFGGVGDQNTNFKPADGGMGGILLLNDQQTENANNLIPQGFVVGYAGDSTSSGDTRRGQRIDGESGAIGTLPVTGFRDKYIFQSDEANGTIKSVSKCSKDGGNGHLFTTFGLEVSNFSGLNNEYNQAYNDDKSILIQAEDGTGTRIEVPTTDGQYRYEEALYDGQYVATGITLTGYRSDRGVTFYNGSFYVLAHHIASGEDRIVKLDEDYAILTETDITISLTESNQWSYSCGILDDGVDLNAIFITAVDTGADEVTFQVLNLTSGLITDTITTDNMTKSTVSIASKTVYTTHRDPNGNENLIAILNTSTGADDKYLVMFDNAKLVIEENMCDFSGFLDGVTTTSIVETPTGGYETLIRLAMDIQFASSNIQQIRYDRIMMSVNDISTVVKTVSDVLEVIVDVNYV